MKYLLFTYGMEVNCWVFEKNEIFMMNFGLFLEII